MPSLVRGAGASLALTAVLALGLAWPALASAQVCADGRTVGPETAGRCCWPGQRWSDGSGRCEGPPSCPAGSGAHGDDCVPLATAVPPGPTAPATSGPAAGPPGRGIFGSHDLVPEPELRSNVPLQVGGVVLLGVGYMLGAAITIPLVLDGSRFGCNTGPGLAFAFAPFAQWGSAFVSCSNGSVLLMADIPLGAVQLAGLILLLVGMPRRPVAPRTLAFVGNGVGLEF